MKIPLLAAGARQHPRIEFEPADGTRYLTKEELNNRIAYRSAEFTMYTQSPAACAPAYAASLGCRSQ